MEDNLNIFEKWKKTSIFFQMEDDLNFDLCKNILAW